MAWRQGEQAALEKLTPLVYGELHRLAHQYMARETPGHTLQTTALVNEVYVRLIDARQMDWQGRAHFVAICARRYSHFHSELLTLIGVKMFEEL